MLYNITMKKRTNYVLNKDLIRELKVFIDTDNVTAKDTHSHRKHCQAWNKK